MKRWVWVSVAITVFLMACAGGLAGYAYYSLKNTADRIYTPLPKTKPKYVSRDPGLHVPAVIDTVSLSPFTVLLLGVDGRRGERGRSDTIIVLTVNPRHRKVLMFNIPRDTRTEMASGGTLDKINHAYALDGIAGSLETVEKFLDIPVDYYVEVNMEGFKMIVDTLNGVEVDNPFAFQFEGSAFPMGKQHLNGAEALKYSRMRYDDPRGDFGRNARQRQIVEEVLHRASHWNNAWEMPALLKTIEDHVRTNLSFGELKDLATKYRTGIGAVKSTEVQGKGEMIGGIYYYLVDQSERTRIHDAMKSLLQ